MRIEYEGTVEVQPPFQHVGYLSAMAMERTFMATETASAAVTAGLVLTLVVARIARRSVPQGHGLATVVAVVVFGLLLAIAPMFGTLSWP